MTDTPLTITARTVVLDLEGTTSAAGFILGDLYDYARPRLLGWLAEHADDTDVAGARARTIADADLPTDSTDADVVAVLHRWMDDDVKATPLKILQGQIWAEGFARGEITSHFFDDVIPKLRAWHAAGVGLAVFSSGSVTSQRPWFAHSPDGDLGGLISAYFDTVNAGPKKVAASYDAIAYSLGVPAAELVFFSDHPDELAAAVAAGWQVVAFARPGEPWSGSDFDAAPVVSTFDAVEVNASFSDAVDPAAVDRAGDALAVEAARFAGLGWMRGTSGNLSVTLSRDPLRLAVTASGLDKGELTYRDVIVVDGDGAPVPGQNLPGTVPSAEAGLHARIAARTGAGAVVHVHALAAVLAGEHWPGGVELRDLEMLKGIGHAAHDETVTVPVIPNGQDMTLVGKDFDAAHVPGVPVVIVARHGFYAWGEDLKQARWHAEIIEWLLRFTVATRAGTPAVDF